MAKTKAPLPLDHFHEPGDLPWAPGRSRGDLPHLQKAGATYFVTFCLADAVLDRQRRGQTEDDSPEGLARLSEPPRELGEWLLARPELADKVESALLHFNGERYLLHAWCVLPDHVHVVITPREGNDLSRILHSWKSFSAHSINSTIDRSGKLWEPESFDHMVRSAEHFERFVRYVEDNPVQAGLCRRAEDWRWGSARLRSAGRAE